MTWALNTFQQTVLCGAGSLNELSGHLQLFGHERVVLVSSRRAPVDLVRASLGDAQVVMEVADVEAHQTHKDGEWWPIAALDQAGLPTLFAKAADAIRRAE